MTDKVVFIANSGFTIVNFRSELIQSFRNLGFKVYVLCPENCSLIGKVDLLEKLSTLGVEFIPIELNRSGLNPYLELRCFLTILKILRILKPDLVLNYTIKPTIYGSIASKLASVHKVSSNITGIGYVFTSKSLKAILIAKLIKFQYKLALMFNYKVFFQNPDDRDYFISMGLVNEKKCVLINGSGVDVKYFERSQKVSTVASFLFVGRLLKDKGINEYVKAAKILKIKYPGITFSVLGPLDDNPNCLSKKSLETILSTDVIKYHGTSNDVRKFLDEHAILVLPSYREGTPRSVLEAMSMSMPIITTNAPGCRETVEQNVNGFKVDVADYISLASSMEKLILQPDLIEKFGFESRRIACGKYSVKLVNNAILKALI